MDIIALLKTKTFWTGVATAAVGVGAYVAGEATVTEALQPLAIGLLGIFLRHGLVKATPVIADLSSAPATPGLAIPVPAAGPLADLVGGLQATLAQAQAMALQTVAQALQSGLQAAVSVIPNPSNQEVPK